MTQNHTEQNVASVRRVSVSSVRNHDRQEENENDILRTLVTKSVIGATICFLIVAPIAVYIAHKDAHEVWQQERQKSNIMKPHTEKIRTNVNGQPFDMNVHISETDNAVRYNINGKVIDMDKRVVFNKECHQVNKKLSDGLQLPEVSQNMLLAVMLYGYKFMTTEYCYSFDIKGYITRFDKEFSNTYNNAIKALTAYAGNNVEKCVIKPTIEARAKYLHEEMESMYTSTKLEMELDSNYKISLTKSEFCEMLNTDKIAQDTLFDTYKSNMEIIKNSAVSLSKY